jgi:DNA-binding MarR family transcriptional regulator
MSSTLEFGTQLIGQTEKTLNAILGRLLAGTDITEPQWVTLTVAVMSGGSVPATQFASRVAGALKVGGDDARTRIDELANAQLIELRQTDEEEVSVTDAGRELHADIRGQVTEITQRLWGDLSADDLATAGRVLSTVLERANAELARI